MPELPPHHWLSLRASQVPFCMPSYAVLLAIITYGIEEAMGSSASSLSTELFLLLLLGWPVEPGCGLWDSTAEDNLAGRSCSQLPHWPSLVDFVHKVQSGISDQAANPIASRIRIQPFLATGKPGYWPSSQCNLLHTFSDFSPVIFPCLCRLPHSQTYFCTSLLCTQPPSACLTLTYRHSPKVPISPS